MPASASAYRWPPAGLTFWSPAQATENRQLFALVRQLERQMPGIEIGALVYPVRHDEPWWVLRVGRLYVPPALRGQGYASRVMEGFTRLADRRGWWMSLTPEPFENVSQVRTAGQKGLTLPRLRAFYKHFGLRPNRGRRAVFEISDAMVRAPES